MLKKLIPSEMSPALKPVLVTDEAGLEQVADFLRRTFVFGLDLETNVTPMFYTRRIRTIQLGDRNEQYVIDLLPFAQRAGVPLVDTQGNYKPHSCLQPIIDVLRPALFSNLWLKVGANLQFEYENLKWCLGIRTFHFSDIFLAEKVLHCGAVHFMATGFWAVENLVARYCGLEMQNTELGKTFDLSTPLTQDQIDYCGLDVRLPLAVRAGQAKQLLNAGLITTCQIEYDAIPAFGDMKLNGLQLDEKAWRKIISDTLDKKKQIIRRMDKFFIPVVGTKFVSDDDVKKMAELEVIWRNHPGKTLEEKEGRKESRKKFMVFKKSVSDRSKLNDKCEGDAFINYAATGQLKKALEKMGFKLADTNDRTLELLASDAKLDVDKAFAADETLEKFTVIDVIRLFRSVDKSLKSYGTQWLLEDKEGYVNPFTCRIHSNINQLGAATGRTSSNDPNVQNIPKESQYRACFICRLGYLMLIVDMSGAELRILAEMSGEPVWVEAFRKGWDVHSVCAEIIFGQEWKDGTEETCVFQSKKAKCECKAHKKLRDIAKSLNFGLAYGMGPQKLADEVGITLESAKKVFELFQTNFPIVFKFLEELGKAAVYNMEARDMVGRRRKWTRPTWEQAAQRAKEDLKDKTKNPTQEQIRKKFKSMHFAIEREGKNAPIQGSNASFMKKAMGCGYAPDGTPYLWHTLEPQFGTLVVNMIHDELVAESPHKDYDYLTPFYEGEGITEETHKQALAEISSAMTKASGEFMKTVVMETEGHIDTKWSK